MPSSIAALSAISAGKTRTTFSPAGGTSMPSDCRRFTMSPAGTAGVHWMPCRKPMPRCST